MPTYHEDKIRVEVREPGRFNAAEVDKDLGEGQLYGLDTEGTYLLGPGPFHKDFKLRLVQLATEDVAWVFRMDDPVQVNYVKRFLANDNNSFTSYTDHDTQAVNSYLGVDISLRNLDCRILSTMASPDDRMGGVDLKTITEKYLKVKWLSNAQAGLNQRFKDLYEENHEKKGSLAAVAEYGWNNIPLSDPLYVLYAGLDAVAVRRLVPTLIRASKAPQSLLRMETWADSQAAQMKMRGMLVDQAAYDKLYKFAKEKCDYHAEEFGKIVQEPYLKGRGKERKEYWKPVSPRSGRKVARFLYEHGADFTGFPLTDTGAKLAEKGELSFEDEVEGKYASLSGEHKDLIQAMKLDNEGQKAADHLFAFKEQVYTMTKLEEIAKVVDHNGVVHPTLRTVGAVTGRMTSSGPNTQNYSRSQTDMREIFIPRPGYVFIGCDYAQIEVKVAAALSQCPVLVDLVLSGKSMHEMTMEATGLDKPHAKILNFLCLFNGGPAALYKQTGIPVSQGKEIVQTFWRTYYGVDEFRKYAASFETELRTISNRRIPIPYNFKKHEYMTYKGINYMIQGAARELLVAGWWRFKHTPGTEDMHVWALIHDEIVIEVKGEEIEKATSALQNAMTFDFYGLPVDAEALVLADKSGRSFWTTGTKAKEYQEYRQEKGIDLKW